MFQPTLNSEGKDFTMNFLWLQVIVIVVASTYGVEGRAIPYVLGLQCKIPISINEAKLFNFLQLCAKSAIFFKFTVSVIF